MRKSLYDVFEESTCQKRLTIVELYDKQGHMLSRESNRCSPDGGVCSRLNLIQDKENYDVHSQCNWTHAEIVALNAVPEGSVPYRAVLLGHTFYCNTCQDALRQAGVEVFEIVTKEWVQARLSNSQDTFDDLCKSHMSYNESYYFYLWGKLKVFEKLLSQL